VHGSTRLEQPRQAGLLRRVEAQLPFQHLQRRKGDTCGMCKWCQAAYA
jgi:hypothetical protein